MHIDWAIPCRYVEVHDNLGTIIGAGVDTYWVRDLPTTIQVVLAIRVLGMADELTEEVAHSSANRVRDPSGEIVSEISGDFRIGAEVVREDWLTGFIVSSVVQFEVTQEGTYTIDTDVDGSSQSLPIHVVHGTPPGTEWPEVPDEPENP